jgi:ADP-heptose:LPS heptosyltransferase
MSKIFIINGGAGRVITAIPALEKYHRLNPTDDFKVIVHGWESLYWSHPILQPRTIGIHQKDVFEQYIKPRQTICPEPYYQYDYYNQKISLAEAFDREINNTQDHSDLTKPNLYLSSYEKNSVKRIIREFKEKQNKAKVIVFQPYGSSMQMMNNRPFDSTHRSLDSDDYLFMIEQLSKDSLLLYFGPAELRHPGDQISVDLKNFNPDLRMFMALISESDYFVGCDSVGQHIAMAFDKPGAIFMGSTFEKNVTYPKHFKIFRNKKKQPTYSPIRFGGVDSEFTDRLNDGIMQFTKDDLKHFCNIINFDIYSE